MNDILFNLYLASLVVYFCLAAVVTWIDKGISVKNAIIFTMVGVIPVVNVVIGLVLTWVLIKDNKYIDDLLNSSIFTRK